MVYDRNGGQRFFDLETKGFSLRSLQEGNGWLEQLPVNQWQTGRKFMPGHENNCAECCHFLIKGFITTSVETEGNLWVIQLLKSFSYIKGLSYAGSWLISCSEFWRTSTLELQNIADPCFTAMSYLKSWLTLLKITCAGFRTKVLPAAKHAALFHASIISG